jgi:hypothetical protein
MVIIFIGADNDNPIAVSRLHKYRFYSGIPESAKIRNKIYLRSDLMTDDAAIVFHGFLNLKNLEKLSVVEAINEYFDSNDREPIRSENEKRFSEIDPAGTGNKCKCCGR